MVQFFDSEYKEFDIALIKYCLNTERLHRHVFDNVFIQTHDTTTDDIKSLGKYYTQCKNFPLFRQYLKKWKEELQHINDSDLTDGQRNALELLLDVNTNRYSSYPDK
jgi:uncharacterized protein Usg